MTPSTPPDARIGSLGEKSVAVTVPVCPGSCERWGEGRLGVSLKTSSLSLVERYATQLGVSSIEQAARGRCTHAGKREGVRERTLYRISPVVASHTVSARSAPPAATMVPVCPSGVTCRLKHALRSSCSNPAGAP